MNNRSRRDITQLDYLVYHKTGKKTARSLELESDNMDEEDKLKPLKIKEAQIAEEISTTFETYDLDELDSSEIVECVGLLKDLGQQYRYVHAELQAGLDAGYNAAYPDYAKICQQMIQFIKNASAQSKKLRAQEQEKVETKNDEKVKTKLKIREQVFQDKLKRVIKL